MLFPVIFQKRYKKRYKKNSHSEIKIIPFL